MSNNKSRLKTATLSCLLLITALITACGGGGGGDGEDGPKLSVVYPTSNVQITQESNRDFEVKFLTDIPAGTFKAKLNGNDITPFFKASGDRRKASFNSIKGFIEDGQNTFVASASDFSVGDIVFTADIVSGELIITEVSSADVGIPQPDNQVRVSGVSRKGNLDTVTVTEREGNGISVDSGDESRFTFSAITIPSNTKKSEEPDFTFISEYDDGKTHKMYLAANGKLFDTLGAFQLNNAAFDEMTPWLSELLGAFVDNNLSVLSLEPNSDYCQLLELEPTGNEKCGINLVDIGIGGDNLPLSPDITTSIEVVKNPEDYGIDPIEGLVLEIELGFSNFKVDIEIPVENTTGDLLGTIESRWLLDDGSKLKIRAIAYYDYDAEGNAFMGIMFPEQEGDTFQLSANFVEAQYSGCRVSADSSNSNFCNRFNTVNDFIDLAITGDIEINGEKVTVEKILNDQLESFLDQTLENSDGQVVTIRDYVKEEFQFENLVVGSTLREISPIQKISLQQTILPGKLNTAADAVNDNDGAFFALGGGALVTASDGVLESEIKAALGSKMNIDPLPFMQQNLSQLGNNTSDIELAITENMLNQALMASYQAGIFNSLSVEDPITFTLEVLTTTINVRVTADVHMNSLPNITLRTDNSMLLKAQEVKVVVKYYDDDSPLFELDRGTPLVTTKLDIEALMRLTVVDKQPVISVQPDDVFIRVIGNPVINDPTLAGQVSPQLIKDVMASSFPELLASTLGDLGSGFIPDFGGFDFDVEAFMDGDVDNATYETIRRQLPKQFKLTLEPAGISIDDSATHIKFSGDLEETDDTDNSLFSINFCSSADSEAVSDAGKCAE